MRHFCEGCSREHTPCCQDCPCRWFSDTEAEAYVLREVVRGLNTDLDDPEASMFVETLEGEPFGDENIRRVRDAATRLITEFQHRIGDE